MKRNRSGHDHCARCGATIIRVMTGGDIVVRDGRVMRKGALCLDGGRCSSEPLRAKR